MANCTGRTSFGPGRNLAARPAQYGERLAFVHLAWRERALGPQRGQDSFVASWDQANYVASMCVYHVAFVTASPDLNLLI